jgi:trans-aconitate 2-methyltransferase
MKKKIIALVLAFVMLSMQVFAKDWAGWNEDNLIRLYFHNSELQTQWAWTALSHYPLQGNERVLDFGSGDGKLSALISRMVPKGKVTGVDISKEMVAFASKMFPVYAYANLNFISSEDIDFSQNTFLEKFDLVTSFCVFHLIPNPVKVLKNIKETMKSKGKLILTFPIKANPELIQAASEEMAIRGLSFPVPTEESLQMRNPDTIRLILEQAGFDVEQLQVIDARDPFSSRNELVDWFEGTLSGNWNIPVEGRRQFFSDLADRYLQYRPEDKEDNFVYYSIKRVDLIASPKQMSE